jgi:hypothetical protein
MPLANEPRAPAANDHPATSCPPEAALPAPEPARAPKAEPVAKPRAFTPTPAAATEEHAATAAGPGPVSFLFTALLSLACGLGGAYLFMHFLAAPRGAGASDKSAAAAPDSGPSADVATADEARALGERIDRLTKRLAELKKAQAEAPEAADSSDVESLRVRVADLTDSTNNLSSLPGKVEHLDNRVSELSSMIQSNRSELVSLRSRVGGPDLLSSNPAPDEPAPREAASGHGSRASSRRSDRAGADTNPAETGPPVTTPTPLNDQRAGGGGSMPGDRADHKALAQGAKLFRQGRYKEALGVFDGLELTDPDDARVWYYAALSDGFATNDWAKGAVSLVEKGVSREQAGTPGKADIDAEFKDLTTATGRDWLAAYRKRVGPVNTTDAKTRTRP